MGIYLMENSVVGIQEVEIRSNKVLTQFINLNIKCRGNRFLMTHSIINFYIWIFHSIPFMFIKI